MSRLRWSSMLLLPLSVLIACEDPTGSNDDTGSIAVAVTTTGTNLDDGYTVAVSGTTQDIDANGSATFADLAPGDHAVELVDVAANCAVTPPNPDTATVAAGETTDVSFAVTCGESTQTLLAEAQQELEDALWAASQIDDPSDLDAISFQAAHDLYAEAFAQAPDNDIAAFGVAITSIFLIEDDPELQDLIDDWEEWSETTDESWAMASFLMPTVVQWERVSLPLNLSGADVERLAYSGLAARTMVEATAEDWTPPPSLPRHQAVLEDVVWPALLTAAEALETIDAPEFVFTVTERMQGDEFADPLELDYTEVLALHAALEVALASIDLATAYVLEPDPTSGISGAVDALQPGSTFLTIGSEGAAKLSDALDRLRSAVGLLEAGLDNLESEADDQDDDIIKYDASGSDGLSSGDIAEAREALADVDDALSGPRTYTFDEGGSDQVTLTVDVTQFFVDPIEDFKALLPAYEVLEAPAGESETQVVFRWDALSLDEWTFPDPTFSGMLPDMVSSADLVETFELAELFYEATVAAGDYVLISIDGVDCKADDAAGGNGCAFQGEHIVDGWVWVDGWEDGPEAYLELWGSASFWTYGPYSLAETAEDTYAVTIEFGTETVEATLVDRPGYTSVDTYYRRRGGSSLTFTWMGSEFVFEKD